jgi:hypothetical protein
VAQACATAYCRNVISGREAAQQIEDGVLAGRGSNRTGLHSRTEEMASALSRFRRTLALPESGDRSTVSRRLDSHRLPGSYRSEIRTWQDRISHVPSHIPCVAGRDRSTRGRTAETHATRARFNHDGPVWKCFGLGKTQGQSANCATSSEEACQPTGFHSINKGNCEPVPLIGQFWTVVTSAQLPVTL